MLAVMYIVVVNDYKSFIKSNIFSYMTVAEKMVENAKNSNISTVATFSKGMPPQFDADGLLQVGDVIIIPSTMPQVYEQKFGANKAEFIVVELKKANGTTTAFNFFPASLSKTIFPAEEVAGVVKLKLPVDHPNGTAVDHYLSFRGKGTAEKTDVQLAMESMLGWSIRIDNDKEVKVQKWVDGKAVNELKTSHVYTYNKV